MKKNTGWGHVADWYDGIVHDSDSYQVKVILPNLVRLMNITSTDRIIDIGCGQGFFSHAFAREAKEVVGIDIGKELISLANKDKNSRERFVVASSHETGEKLESFEKATMVLSLQNIKSLPETLHEVARLLVPGGKLYIVLNHPAFRIPQNSDWGFDEKKRMQYRRTDLYLSEQTISIDMHPGKKTHQTTTSFHRPLQVYMKALGKAGFGITNGEEWISHKISDPGPRARYEDRARKEIPMFLVLEATKIRA